MPPNGSLGGQTDCSSDGGVWTRWFLRCEPGSSGNPWDLIVHNELFRSSFLGEALVTFLISFFYLQLETFIGHKLDLVEQR